MNVTTGRPWEIALNVKAERNMENRYLRYGKAKCELNVCVYEAKEGILTNLARVGIYIFCSSLVAFIIVFRGCFAYLVRGAQLDVVP